MSHIGCCDFRTIRRCFLLARIKQYERCESCCVTVLIVSGFEVFLIHVFHSRVIKILRSIWVNFGSMHIVSLVFSFPSCSKGNYNCDARMVHCTYQYSLYCFVGNSANQISINATVILCSMANIAFLLARSLGAGLPWVTFFYHSGGLPRILRLSQAMNLFWTRESNGIVFSFSFRYRRWTWHDFETTPFWSLCSAQTLVVTHVVCGGVLILVQG